MNILENVTIANKILEREDLPEEVWVDVSFLHCDLSKLNFESIVMKYVSFISCEFQGAIFEDATLDYVYFQDCNLQEVKAKSACLVDAHFMDCNCSGSDFTDSIIADGCIYDSNFTGAIMDEVMFKNIDFGNVVFDNAHLVNNILTNIVFNQKCYFRDIVGEVPSGANVITEYSAEDKYLKAMSELEEVARELSNPDLTKKLEQVKRKSSVSAIFENVN